MIFKIRNMRKFLDMLVKGLIQGQDVKIIKTECRPQFCKDLAFNLHEVLNMIMIEEGDAILPILFEIAMSDLETLIADIPLTDLAGQIYDLIFNSLKNFKCD